MHADNVCGMSYWLSLPSSIIYQGSLVEVKEGHKAPFFLISSPRPPQIEREKTRIKGGRLLHSILEMDGRLCVFLGPPPRPPQPPQPSPSS